MALKPITKYERYDCDADPNHTFKPDELASMREWDKVLNARYCIMEGYSITEGEAQRSLAMVLQGIPAYKALRTVRLERQRESGAVL